MSHRVGQAMYSPKYGHLIWCPKYRRRLPLKAGDAWLQEIVTQEVIGHYAMHYWRAS